MAIVCIIIAVINVIIGIVTCIQVNVGAGIVMILNGCIFAYLASLGFKDKKHDLLVDYLIKKNSKLKEEMNSKLSLAINDPKLDLNLIEKKYQDSIVESKANLEVKNLDEGDYVFNANKIDELIFKIEPLTKGVIVKKKEEEMKVLFSVDGRLVIKTISISELINGYTNH